MKSIRILSVGNSFSMDTMEHLANVALHAGFDTVRLGNLYVGGCSVRKHFYHAQNDMAVYTYYTNDGSGWKEKQGVSIAEAVRNEEWDWISVQHGTADGSFYSKPEDYEKLPELVAILKSLASEQTRIAFNMTWVGEPTFPHHEIKAFGGNTDLLYRRIVDLTRDIILPMEGIDRISPTGTAVQNARTSCIPTLTRDGFHLTWGTGRYIASLTFLQALTDVRIESIDWAPESTNETEKAIALVCARNAVANPYAVVNSQSKFHQSQKVDFTLGNQWNLV